MRHPGQMQIGLEVLLQKPRLAKDWGKCGLLLNQASVTRDFVSAQKICEEILGVRLRALFGPQHGFAGVVQDNMIETPHLPHPRLNIPIFSLYSETREPTEEMLSSLDTLIIDLQNVGCRVYTFKWTVAACLRAAKKYGKRIVVLDRPNPLGGNVLEGRVVDDNRRSFVGEAAIPLRHALTMGEAARLFNQEIGAALEIIKLEYWQPESYWHELERPWVLTSPNLPTFDSVVVYPGLVLFEGTNISEGRGTGLPFQLIGAPYIKSGEEVISRVRDLNQHCLDGVFLRPATFQPTSNKHQGRECQGVQVHVVDPKKVRSVSLALCLLKSFMDLGGKEFAWKEPPYEYDYVNRPIELILGSEKILKKLSDFSVTENFWSEGINLFTERRLDESFLLYERNL